MNFTTPARHLDSPRTLSWLLSGLVMLLLNWSITKIGVWFAQSNEATLVAALTMYYMTAGIALLACMAWLWRSTFNRGILGWILAVGLVMRLLAITEPPRHETDFYRYMWDGAVTAHGYNPYTIRPRDVIEYRAERLPKDAAFAMLSEQGRETLAHVNQSNLTTIYPLVTQAFFAIAYWIKPFNTQALRAVFLGAELVMVFLLLALLRTQKLPLHWIAFYWWHPIVLKECYVAAHMDGLAAMFALAAVGAVMWRWRPMGIVLLGLAIGVKLWPVILAPILLRYGVKSRREFFGGLALLVSIAGLLMWPLLANASHESQSGLNSYAHYWTNNAGLFSAINWSTRQLQLGGITLGLWSNLTFDSRQLARQITLGLVLLWMLFLSRRKLPDIASVTRWSMVAIGGLFVLSPTQFPWYYIWVLPFLVLAPARALLLYTALLPLYHLQYEYPFVLWLEHLPVWFVIMWSVWRWCDGSMNKHSIHMLDSKFRPPCTTRVSVIIPALNEERAIAQVLAAIPTWVTRVIVADNGSTDRTASVAKRAGATVVSQPERGYGAACLAGISVLDQPDIVVFLDGDFSDHPQEMSRLIEPITRDEADMVIGSRVLGCAEAGALTVQQRFGNALACRLIRLLYGTHYTDLGPFRAIRFSSLQRLAMDDRDYGWTVQMQVRAARLGLRATEVPVSYRRRIGVSKISGTIRGVVGAGGKIISTIFRENFRPKTGQRFSDATERLIIFARHPEPGRAKTRMIPLLGPVGAAMLHQQLVRITLEISQRLFARRNVAIEMRSTGAITREMQKIFGADVTCRDQGQGDLGERLHQAAAEALDSSARRVVLIGTDCPLLTTARLEEAFIALEEHDIVIGPATDGGYYLIGMKSGHPELFVNIAWGGAKVLAQTLNVCRRLSLRYVLLPALSDVDVPDDLATWATTKLAAKNISPEVSVIIPARNEQDRLAATIASVLTAGRSGDSEGDVEIIVVDGQSTDRTVEIARAFGVTVMSSEASRGIQLNLGAEHARGEVLLFLHADTLLPMDYIGVIRGALDDSNVSAGAFDLKIDARGAALRMIEWGVRIRSRIFGRPYGDQAMFMTAPIYHQCGGFPALPAMEDYAMLSRLHNLGQVHVVRDRVSTSARKWKRLGWLGTTLVHQWMIVRYHWHAQFHRKTFEPNTDQSMMS